LEVEQIMKDIPTEVTLKFDMSISIVHFGDDIDLLDSTLASLAIAVKMTADINEYFLVLVDNGPENCRDMLELLIKKNNIRGIVISGHGNIGYGCGHNLAFSASGSSVYHLVLNPDISIAPDALTNAITFMENNRECGLLTPSFNDQKGERLYLCKRYPSVTTLGLRAFAPKLLRGPLLRRSWHYEMRDVIGDGIFWDPEIVSGCFMFFRSDVFRGLCGFDSRYFLYFEDFDISMRLPSIARIAFVPSVHITHFGGGAAQKGLRHIFMFCRSAIIFFNMYGWKFI
jgi:GT2 family glycosyltransferase